MDADTLRLTLMVLGAGLILGIYLWEKRKHSQSAEQEEERLEPTLKTMDETLVEPAMPDPPAGQQSVGAAAPAGVLHEPSAPPPSQARPTRHSDAAKSEKDKAADALPVLILQINIAASDERFQGKDILQAVKAVNLSAGSMRIFHRRAGDEPNGAVLFSMASMVEPGVFPLDAMDGFSTPGLTLFAQLPGVEDGLAIFSDLIDTAERIADLLHGELQDDTHSRLTRQTIEHLRSQVLEHRRRLQLAKSRVK